MHYHRDMTLEVPFVEYVATVRRVLPGAEVYIARHASGTLVTAADPAQNTVVACVVSSNLDTTRKQLESAGVECHPGSWFDPESPAMAATHTDVFVGAVAYKTGESAPGIWVDAYDALPTQIAVLRRMFEEFRETGELDDVTFEEFTKHAEPTVAIVSPAELHSFIEDKAGC